MQWSTPRAATGLPRAAPGLAGSAAHTRLTGKGHKQRRRAQRRGDHIMRHAIVTEGRDRTRARRRKQPC